VRGTEEGRYDKKYPKGEGWFVMSAEEIKALELRSFEVMNKGKDALMAAMEASTALADDLVFHSETGVDTRGQKEFKQSLSELYDAFPDLHFTVDDIVVEGNEAVVRYTATGTHKGTFMGIPPTNKKVTVWEISIDRFVGGKIVESWARTDTLGLMQQLGVLPKLGKQK
jgi:steroid delta-isomerase-like uncharacterized protein